MPRPNKVKSVKSDKSDKKVNKNQPKGSFPKFALLSDGTVKGTKILINGEELQNVYEFQINGDSDSGDVSLEYINHNIVNLANIDSTENNETETEADNGEEAEAEGSDK